jgi:hypothetical protein
MPDSQELLHHAMQTALNERNYPLLHILARASDDLAYQTRRAEELTNQLNSWRKREPADIVNVPMLRPAAPDRSTETTAVFDGIPAPAHGPTCKPHGLIACSTCAVNPDAEFTLDA